MPSGPIAWSAGSPNERWAKKCTTGSSALNPVSVLGCQKGGGRNPKEDSFEWVAEWCANSPVWDFKATIQWPQQEFPRRTRNTRVGGLWPTNMWESQARTLVESDLTWVQGKESSSNWEVLHLHWREAKVHAAQEPN